MSVIVTTYYQRSDKKDPDVAYRGPNVEDAIEEVKRLKAIHHYGENDLLYVSAYDRYLDTSIVLLYEDNRKEVEPF